MTVQDLVQLLQQQAASAPHQIILNDAALGRSDLDNLIKQQLQRSAGNILVVVNPTDIPTNPPATGFSLPGLLPSNQADSFLNLTNKNVTVNFVMNGTAIDFTLDVTLTKENNLPANWSFGTSFSDMPGSGLDSLDLSDPHFILATSATPYMQNSQLALSVGLNFYSPLSLTGLLDEVATLISKNPVQLSDGRSSTALLPSATGSKSLSLFGLITWAASDTQGPAFDLRADLHIPSLSIGDVLALETLFVGARRLYTTDSPPQSVIMIYMGATVKIQNSTGTQVNLDVYALLSPQGNSPTMVMLLLPHMPTDTSIANLGQLIAGNSWNSLFSGPAQKLLPYLDTFALKSFSAAIGLSALSILSISLTAGITKPWRFFNGKFIIEKFDVAWLILSPTKNATMIATLTTEFQLFNDPNLTFDLEVVIPNLTISGQYKGTLDFTLAELLNKVSSFFGFSSLSVPDNLATFRFSALVLFIDEPNSIFTFSGAAQIALNLFGIELLGLQNTNFNITVDSTGLKAASLDGILTIVGVDFAVNASITDKVVFQIHLTDMTFGKLLSYLVSLVDPDRDFTLDAPWDLLNSINLSNLLLAVNVTDGIVNVHYASNIQLGFIDITAFELTYTKKTGLAGVKIALECTFLGISYGQNNPLAWDALNDAPPAVPGKDSSLFDLEYLGLGQHITLVDTNGKALQIARVSDVIDALQSKVIPADSDSSNDPTRLPGLAFDPNSGWLIGTRFTVIDTVALSIIFNDPVVYGLLITFSGEKAKIFAGLSFEILYRKVTDTIGVYHTELKLPDDMRHLEFGEVSVTLPVVALDVYTNGDFKIDIGFPSNGDFSRSFAVEAFPFIGAGGFYFAKLSAATATDLPQITNGSFNPVIEFGIGLRIGLGKDISEGIFSAGISILVQGIFEGALAWFNPNAASMSKDMYYKTQGVLIIVGHIYGSIDFEIVQASVDFEVYAAVKAVIEVYQPILIDLIATVSVSVSIKIVFIRISFSFSATIRQHFALGSASPTPWILAPAPVQSRAFARTSRMQMLAAIRRAEDDLFATVRLAQITQTNAPNWQPLQVWTMPKTLDLHFHPVFTYGLASDDLNDAARPEPGPNDYDECKGLILLLIQNGQLDGPSLSNKVSPFDLLMQALLVWTIQAYDKTAPVPPTIPLSTCDLANNANTSFGTYVASTKIDLESLQSIYEYLTTPGQNGKVPFTHQNLVDLFAQNFCFHVMPLPDDPPPDTDMMSMSVFPMFPEMMLTTPGKSAGTTVTVDFNQQNAVPKNYLTTMQEYFNQLKVDYKNQVDKDSNDQLTADRAVRNALASESISIANFVFQDYFALLVRAAVQRALDYLNEQKSDSQPNTSMSLEQLLNALLTDTLATNKGFNNASGMVSRFLLHGLRLPEPTSLNTMRTANTPHLTKTHPLYAFTGQQFTVYSKPTNGSTYTITLQSSAPLNWLQYRVAGQAASKLDYQLASRDVDILNGLSLDKLKATLANLTVNRLILYRQDNRRYNFQHRITWNAAALPLLLAGQADSGQPTLWDFPDSLLTQLATLPAADSTAALNLDLREGKPDASVNTGLHSTPVQAYAWATRIDMHVQSIPNLAANGDLTNTYTMIGTDEVGRGYLEALWKYMTALLDSGQSTLIPRLYILYQPQVGGSLFNQIPQQALLLKTNLSTESHSQRNFATMLFAAAASSSQSTYAADIGGSAVAQTVATNLDFIKLLWECSVVNTGGYYFHYQGADGTSGLPDSLFSNGKSALLNLLIVLEPTFSTSVTPQQKALQAQVRNFHNTVLLEESMNIADQSLLFAATTDPALQVKVPTVGPGNVGFVSSRPAIDTYELSGLYQLLSYTVTAQDNLFNPSNAGLPVSPADSLNDATFAPNTDVWNYRKIVPYAKFALQNSVSDVAGLPLASGNPYAGITGTTKVHIELAVGVNDLYGNMVQESHIAVPSLEVGYTDTVIGVAEWPSVAGTYYFESKDTSTARLWALLHLNTSQYMPDQSRSLYASIAKAEGDRAKYAQIYYQMSQQDVTCAISTSVVTLPNGALDKSTFIEYIGTVYRYLSSVTQLQVHLLDVKMAPSLVIADLAKVYRVNAAAFVTENSSLANLFAPNTQLQVPGYYQVRFGDSWQSIAQANDPATKTDALKLAAKISDLATRNQSAYPLLQPGTIIPIGTSTYTTTGTELLTDIVAKHIYVTTSDLAHANPSAPLNQPLQLTIRGAQVTTQLHDTLTILVNRYNSKNNLTTTDQLTAYEVGLTNPGTNLFAAGPLTVPINHQIGIADTLTDIVSLYQKDTGGLTVASLVASLQSNANWLQSGARVCIEVLPLVSNDGDTFDVLTNRANDAIRAHNQLSTAVPYEQITATDLALFNTNLSLYPNMGPDVNHLQGPMPVLPVIPYQLSVYPKSSSVYSLKASDTLNVLASNDPSYAADVVTANKAVQGILVAETPVTLGGISLTISPNDSFQSLLDYFNVQLKQSYCISATTLQSLRALGLPPSGLLALATIKGVFVDATTFLAAVQVALGTDQTATYRVALLELARQFNATAFTLSDLAQAVSHTDGLFHGGQLILLPPPTLKIGVDFTPNAASYNTSTIFPVTVAITISRQPALVSSDFQDVPTVISATAELTARPLADPSAQTGAEQPTSLHQFAHCFQKALPELKLAIGTATKNIYSAVETNSHAPHMALEDTNDEQPKQPRQLWAVKMGKVGFVYHVQNKAYYFAPAPLSNTLMSGQATVQSYQTGSGLQSGVAHTFSNVDLDSWAQTFLAALDQFLDPNFVVPAFHLTVQTPGSASQTGAQFVQAVLDSKQKLASVIAGRVTNILVYTNEDVSYQRSQAVEALTEALLTNLSSAYSTDTICVVPVTVEQSPYSQANNSFAPRLSGKPIVAGLDPGSTNKGYSLSTAKVPLYLPDSQQPQSPSLTFLFSTKSPSANRYVSLTLTYAVNELEFNIQNMSGIASYQASSWLNFILPLNDGITNDPNMIGTLDIPVPLRVSPLPPSLVDQQIIPQHNNTPGVDLAAVRMWTYQYTYEHLNAKQDNIYTDVLYNVVPQSTSTPLTSNSVSGTQNLFEALANFVTNYAAIQADLNLLPYMPDSAAASVKTTLLNAITAFSQLVSNVAAAWSVLNAPVPEMGQSNTLPQYEYMIDELSSQGTDTLSLTLTYEGQTSPVPVPFPNVMAFGYTQASATADPNQPTMTYTFTRVDGKATPPVPQRTLIIPNRDVVVNWQNAWGGVWLTRNEKLVPPPSTQPSNPAFIYRTPEIRFNSPAVPFLVDNQLRDVASIGGTGQARTMLDHIKAVFSTLFPVAVTYNIKLICNYGFQVATPASSSSDSPLAVTVPVLLYHQRTDLSNDTFYQQVAGWLADWQRNNPLPTETSGSFYQFDITLFSNLIAEANNNQPEHVLLQVSNFILKFKDVAP